MIVTETVETDYRTQWEESPVISFLVAMTKDLTRNNSREEGSLWLTVQRDTAHHHRRNSNAAIGLWYQQGSRKGGDATAC